MHLCQKIKHLNKWKSTTNKDAKAAMEILAIISVIIVTIETIDGTIEVAVGVQDVTIKTEITTETGHTKSIVMTEITARAAAEVVIIGGLAVVAVAAEAETGCHETTTGETIADQETGAIIIEAED